MCRRRTILTVIIIGAAIIISKTAGGGVVAQINENSHAVVGVDKYSVAIMTNDQVVNTRKFNNRIINVKWSHAAECLIVDTENLKSEKIECQILDENLLTINTLVAEEAVTALTKDERYLYFCGISQTLDRNVYRLPDVEVAWSFDGIATGCPFFNFADLGNQQWICVKSTPCRNMVLCVQMPENLLIWKSEFDQLGVPHYLPISGVASTGEYIYFITSVSLHQASKLYVLSRSTGEQVNIIEHNCEWGGGGYVGLTSNSKYVTVLWANGSWSVIDAAINSTFVERSVECPMLPQALVTVYCSENAVQYFSRYKPYKFRNAPIGFGSIVISAEDSVLNYNFREGVEILQEDNSYSVFDNDWGAD